MSGSCATLVVVRGDKIYCGDAGDSKAMVFEYDPTKSVTVKAAAPVDLNPRHGTELKSERERILKAGGRISASGAVYGVLYPSRGFGDLDVKSQGKDVVIATPEGAGITEGSLQPQEAYTIKKGKTTYMVVASDGLWDFMTDEEVSECWCWLGREDLTVSLPCPCFDLRSLAYVLTRGSMFRPCLFESASGSCCGGPRLARPRRRCPRS